MPQKVVLERCAYCTSYLAMRGWTPETDRLYADHLAFEHGMFP